MNAHVKYKSPNSNGQKLWERLKLLENVKGHSQGHQANDTI